MEPPNDCIQSRFYQWPEQGGWTVIVAEVVDLFVKDLYGNDLLGD